MPKLSPVNVKFVFLFPHMILCKSLSLFYIFKSLKRVVSPFHSTSEPYSFPGKMLLAFLIRRINYESTGI